MSQDSTEPHVNIASGVYLFCFACTAAIPAVGGPGLEDVGVVSCEVAGDVVAVVEPVNEEDYCGPASEANLRDLAWMAPRAFHHEMVIERVMRSSPVLPVRFGTIFSSTASLAHFLERHHIEIDRFLESVAGKEEWAVKTFLERSIAETRLLEADDRFLALSPSQGMRYMQLRQLRAEAGREVTAWAKKVLQTIRKELASEVTDVRTGTPLSFGGEEEPFVRIANWAFLLRCDKVNHFREQVERIDARYREWGVRLKVSGPWPPYNFCPSLGNRAGTESSCSETPD